MIWCSPWLPSLSTEHRSDCEAEDAELQDQINPLTSEVPSKHSDLPQWRSKPPRLVVVRFDGFMSICWGVACLCACEGNHVVFTCMIMSGFHVSLRYAFNGNFAVKIARVS